MLADVFTFEQTEKGVRHFFDSLCDIFAKLQLDSASGLASGSEAGPVVVSGKPNESRLIQAVRGELVQMPPTGKLADRQIAALAEWVEMGAPWPAEEAPVAVGPEAAFDLEARRKSHWAWPSPGI